MTSDLSDLWHLPIGVEPHAADRIYDRLGWVDHERVSGEVRLALLEGRCSDEEPLWTDHPGSSRDRSSRKPGRFYAWDGGFERVWVVAPSAGRLYVVTVLVEASRRHEVAARRRLLR